MPSRVGWPQRIRTTRVVCRARKRLGFPLVASMSCYLLLGRLAAADAAEFPNTGSSPAWAMWMVFDCGQPGRRPVRHYSVGP